MQFHIYCTVIDNYGDIGVCWRLSQQLANEYAANVTLWVDDWAAARQLIDALPETRMPTQVAGVRISAWSLAHGDDDCTGDVLIEAFACTLPQTTLAQLKSRTQKPIWINLEYFSAEKWVSDFHLRSGHDWDVGATRWFFFPGVGAHSGGMLREQNLIAQREAWQAKNAHQTQKTNTLSILCFAYAHAPYAAWVDGLAAQPTPHVLVSLCGHYTQQAFAKIDLTPYPNLHVQNNPFVSQPQFDQRLWAADVLMVRGEDSLARAVWAGKPFVWHIYPQDANAHHPKLAAWLAHYTQGWQEELRRAYVRVHEAWNGITPPETMQPAWLQLMQHFAQWQKYSAARSHQLAQEPDLATQLMAFVKNQLANEVAQTV